jgi:UPF0176 protein
MVNCANPECNEHLSICEGCGVEYAGACSAKCKEHPRKRPYNGTGNHMKSQNGYHPELAFKVRKKTKKLHIVEDLELSEN